MAIGEDMNFLIFFILTILTQYSFAATDICDTIFRSPNVGCSDLAGSHSSGGSYPLLFDAFNFNPSALPTFPTPVGVEAYYNEKKLNVALIKGTEKVGVGASAKSTDTTFFSGVENYKVALKKLGINSYNPSSLDKNYNIGTALNLFKFAQSLSIPFGFAYRYNAEKKTWSVNPGFEFRTNLLSAGISTYSEKPKPYSDGYYDVHERRDNISFNSSLKFGGLLLDYSVIREKNTVSYYTINSSSLVYDNYYTVITQIFSSTYVHGMMSITSAYRRQNNSRLTGSYASTLNSNSSIYSNSHLLFGAAYKTPRLELGAFYNYILNEDVSMLFKLFF